MIDSTTHRQGFALPTAIVGITVLAVLTTAGFYTARQEFQTGLAQERGSMAFYLAEQGLSEVLDGWNMAAFNALPTWSTVSVSDTTAYGVWTVDITRSSNRVFYLDSRADLTVGGLLGAGASRRLGMVARIASAEIQPQAALTTRGNATVKGNAEVHGEDQDPPHWGARCAAHPIADKPGILIDDTTDVGTVGQGTITGSPAAVQDPTIDASSFTQFGDMDWDELVALADKVLSPGNINSTFPSLRADGSCDVGNPYNWGDPDDPTDTCGGYFPMIYVPGDLRVQSGGIGQGILLVDGDLDLRGGFAFHGIIIVQGNFETQGSGNRVYGAVLAANADFEDQSLVGGSVVQYSGCAAAEAVLNSSSLHRARPFLERSWVDLSSLL